MKPDSIEALSFQIIEQEAGTHRFPNQQWQILRRMIHTTADFEYMQSVRFHPRAVQAGIEAIRRGCTVVTDTRMAMSGIRRQELERFGTTVTCLIDAPQVREKAAQAGTTRAKAAVDAALALMEAGIYVVGNAPTALLRLNELIRAAEARPALIIGLPVGFVNAAESKAELTQLDHPYITNIGRKGGSNVAASVVNALALMAGGGL